MIVERAGRRIFVQVEGEPSAPTSVIALHGGPGFAHEYFRAGLDTISGDGTAVVYVDLPGAGRASRHPGDDLTPYVEDIAAVRDALGPRAGWTNWWPKASPTRRGLGSPGGATAAS